MKYVYSMVYDKNRNVWVKVPVSYEKLKALTLQRTGDFTPENSAYASKLTREHKATMNLIAAAESLRERLIEAALEKSDFKESAEVIEHIRNLGK